MAARRLRQILAGLLPSDGGFSARVARNGIWLGVGQGVTALLNFLLVTVVARSLGPTAYGSFAYALAFVMIFSTLFDFGVASAVNREFAKGARPSGQIWSLARLRLLIGALGVTIVAGAALLAVPAGASRNLILVLAAYLFALEIANLFYAYFRAHQRMDVETWLRLGHGGLLVASVLVAIATWGDVMAVAYAYVATTAVTATAAALLATRVRDPHATASERDWTTWRAYLGIGFFLALAKAVGDITMFGDSVLLGWLRPSEDVGWYGAASRLNALVLLPMSLLTTAAFPGLVAMRARSDPARVSATVSLWARVSIHLAAAAVAIGGALAPAIVAQVFGEGYLPAAQALRWLLLSAALIYMHNILFHVLLLQDQQRMLPIAFVGAAVVSVAANLLLIPRLGIVGAAVASVAAHIATLVILAYFVVRQTPLRPWNGTAAGFAVAGSAAVAAWWVARLASPLHVVAALTLAAVTYAVLAVTGELLSRRLFSPSSIRA